MKIPERLCFVDCGMSPPFCKCREDMLIDTVNDIKTNQSHLPSDFYKAMMENIEELYEKGD